MTPSKGGRKPRGGGALRGSAPPRTWPDEIEGRSRGACFLISSAKRQRAWARAASAAFQGVETSKGDDAWRSL